jgi:ubiquinone/menaquinone biosynthesis C-methylase UbiE
MSPGDPGFPNRNGFALHADLESPELRRMLRLCLQENENFTGEARFDWSRQWEYPFVLANLPAQGSGRRILDAGSGFRFFAPLLAQRGFEVDACDLDASIGPKYDEVAAQHDLAIEFTEQDLSKMTYADETFDYLSCISVLEHTNSPAEIVREFRRCLKIGGSLLLTFDVSVAGDRDIPVEAAKQLMLLLEEEFTPVTPFASPRYLDPEVLSRSDEVLRTQWFRHNQPEALPWRFFSRAGLRNLLRGRIGRPFFDLAVVGLVLRRER